MNYYGAEVVDLFGAPWGTHETCLHYAAFHGHPNIIALLIENGAELDPRDWIEETPLSKAILGRNYSSIRTLIKYGADLEKAKESFHEQELNEEKTKAAIKEGQRLAGE